MNFNANDLVGLLPAVILSVGALVLMMSEVFLAKGALLPGHKRAESVSDSQRAEAQLPLTAQHAMPLATAQPDRRYQAFLAAGFAALGLWAAISQLGDPAQALFGGAAVTDDFGRLIAAVVCASLLISCVLAFSYLESLRATRGEFYALALFSAAGMTLLAQATDLIVIFVSLEVMSLAVYCLSAYLRRGKRPAEAAFKYFVLGSFASAVFLYGAALAYGATGSTRIAELANAAHLQGAGAPMTLLYAAAALLAAGFAFKVAAVPFHMWVPDVYDGAPAPVTGFMAAGVKAAAFATLARILVGGFGAGTTSTGAHGWQGIVIVLAGLTMLVGNLLAIPQRSVKRMLAYSSIAHAGYLLVAVAAMAETAPRGEAISGLLYYLASYAATVLGAFGVVALIERRLVREGGADDLHAWAGLSERHPALAAAMAVFMVSLAGIPPTAGFMAKLQIFRAAIDADLSGLAIFGVLTSVAGLYYYLRVVVYLYMVPSSKAENIPGKLVSAGLALAVCAALVIWMGVQPGPFSVWAKGAMGTFGQ